MTTVLIVDDERALREGLCETVSDLGYDAIAASSGQEALKHDERPAPRRCAS